jgi:hypothetical protein
MIAQHDRNSEHIDIKYIGLNLGSDSCDSEIDSDSGELCSNIKFCFMMAQTKKFVSTLVQPPIWLYDG